MFPQPIKLLVLGSSGLLGSSLLRYFSTQSNIEVYGTARSFRSICNMPPNVREHVTLGIDLDNIGQHFKFIADMRPDVILNCTGIVKQAANADDPLSAISINALLPHRLARISADIGARLIHFSTDCVFSGSRGNYLEVDSPDPSDLYGRSKLLGEIDYGNVITLRTSMIGHELSGSRSLVSWFMSQKVRVRGFRRAIFSGLPTVEIGRVLKQFVLPNTKLKGLYHLSANPINKFDLLSLVAQTYGKSIEVIPDDTLLVDRSLDSSRFRALTGYTPKSWPDLVLAMRNFG